MKLNHSLNKIHTIKLASIPTPLDEANTIS